MPMPVMHAAWCGIAIPQKTAGACRSTPGDTGGGVRAVQTGATPVALASTGGYWPPVATVLEAAGRCAVRVVTARHGKHAPGRKTDVRDAAWLAEVLQHGLVRGSAVPSREQRDRRALTR